MRKSGLVASVFAPQLPGNKNSVYTIGDKMATNIKGSDSTHNKKHYSGGFPFPKGDLFGICNNYKSASFFIDD
jgi:hypothetical protein